MPGTDLMPVLGRSADDAEILADACAVAMTALDEYAQLQSNTAAIIILGNNAARGAKPVQVDGEAFVQVRADRWALMRRVMDDVAAGMPDVIPPRRRREGDYQRV